MCGGRERVRDWFPSATAPREMGSWVHHMFCPFMVGWDRHGVVFWHSKLVAWPLVVFVTLEIQNLFITLYNAHLVPCSVIGFFPVAVVSEDRGPPSRDGSITPTNPSPVHEEGDGLHTPSGMYCDGEGWVVSR